MTGTTSVPSITLTATGWVAPSESAILTGVEADMNAAFGGDLIFADGSPETQIATTQTAIIGNTNDQLLALLAGVDPAFSTGRLQDAIGRLYFLARNPATSTVVACTCTGAAGTLIRAGAIALATDGNLYLSLGNGTIGVGGTVTIDFACSVTGPIAGPAGSLNQIYRNVIGWDSITNPSDGVEGSNVETAQAFELRREDTVAGNSFGPIGAIIGAVAKVANVLDYWGYSNNTASPVTVSGVTIAANAIYISVEGGLDLDVAQAILAKKAPGAPMGGNTTVTAYDNNPLYSGPQAYSITFERPASLSFFFVVTIKGNSQTPANAGTLIATAIVNAFAGLTPPIPRARIGTTLYALPYTQALNGLWPGIEVTALTVGTSASSSANFTASVASTTMTVTAISSGSLAAGMVLVSGALLPGTSIVAQLTGSAGSTGTYQLNQAQTVGSTAGILGHLATDGSETVTAAQVPTLSSLAVATVIV